MLKLSLGHGSMIDDRFQPVHVKTIASPKPLALGPVCVVADRRVELKVGPGNPPWYCSL